ncbi:MAG: hypothetical protein ACTHW3_11530 [Leucobacter sp.]
MASNSERALRRRRRPTLRRSLLATVAIVGLLLGLTSLQPPDTTAAAWSDTEFSHSSPLTGAVLKAPIVTAVQECRNPLLSGNILSFRWKSPANSPITLVPATTQWLIQGQIASTQPTTTGPNANGEYTTTFTRGLLDGLLGGLLGADFSVSVRAAVPTAGETWTSQQSSSVYVDVPLLLLAPTCTVTNAS